MIVFDLRHSSGPIRARVLTHRLVSGITFVATTPFELATVVPLDNLSILIALTSMNATGNDMSSPGTADYFPALVTRIRTAVPNLPLEPIILESVLLCLVCGSKNLILRTEEEKVGMVAKSVASVSHPFLDCSRVSFPKPLVLVSLMDVLKLVSLLPS